MGKPMWMVRAASGGHLADEFKAKGIVAIGWNDIGNLKNFKEKKEVISAVREEWPEWPAGRVMNSASQLVRFRDELKIDDRVITYDSSQRIYHVGTIRGGYMHNAEMVPPFENVREVEWQGIVDRDKLSLATRNSLGSTLTLFLVPEFAATEVEAVLAGQSPAKSESEEVETEEEKGVLDRYRLEAFEIIKDRVNRLDWEEMQELVAGLLRAMGYKTRISPQGPDRGFDILASPDGFGFESPRIIVEVKHRNQAMGSQEIRSFLGGRHKDDKGLYVSTGGFTKDARYEAERANIPVMLMDIDDLVKAIFRSYESMDIEAQKLVPLKKLYWPV
jgi:restriction system protein